MQLISQLRQVQSQAIIPVHTHGLISVNSPEMAIRLTHVTLYHNTQNQLFKLVMAWHCFLCIPGGRGWGVGVGGWLSGWGGGGGLGRGEIKEIEGFATHIYVTREMGAVFKTHMYDIRPR